MKIFKKLLVPILLILIAVAMQILIQTSFEEENKLISALNLVAINLMIFAVAFGLARTVRIFKHLLLSRWDISAKDNLKSRKMHTQYTVIERIFIFIIILLAIGASLMTFDSIRRIGVSLFASAGVAGLIIGLAAQKVIGSVLAGIQLAFTQPIRLDDVVIVEGEWGWIEEINLTYVVVRIWDKRRLIVPTTYFIEKPFQNWTRVSADILGTVFLYTDYNIDFDALREEQTKVLKQTDLWDGKINIIQVTDVKEESIEIRSLVSAKDSSTAWDLRVLLREKLIEFIRNNYPDALPRTRVEMQPEPLSFKEKNMPEK